MKMCDHGYTKNGAEEMLRVKPGSLTLDELASRLSLLKPDNSVSVRDHTARPIPHSKVYYRGEATGETPYLLRGSK